MGFVNLMLIILILLIVLTMLALVYLFTGNIQSRPPKSLSRNYNLKEYEYQHRQVFTIKPDEEEKSFWQGNNVFTWRLICRRII